MISTINPRIDNLVNPFYNLQENTDILGEVFCFLDAKTLSICALGNRTWYIIANHPHCKSVWDKQYLKEFISSSKDKKISDRQSFIELKKQIIMKETGSMILSKIDDWMPTTPYKSQTPSSFTSFEKIIFVVKKPFILLEDALNDSNALRNSVSGILFHVIYPLTVLLEYCDNRHDASDTTISLLSQVTANPVSVSDLRNQRINVNSFAMSGLMATVLIYPPYVPYYIVTYFINRTYSTYSIGQIIRYINLNLSERIPLYNSIRVRVQNVTSKITDRLPENPISLERISNVITLNVTPEFSKKASCVIL